MKKITLLILMLFTAFCGFAQLPQEGFEAWPPTEWLILQNDVGTTVFWRQSALNNDAEPPYEGDYSAFLDKSNLPPNFDTPQDWLVTKEFTMPDNPELHFFSRLTLGGNDGSLYRVMIIDLTENPGADVNDFSNYTQLKEWNEIEINPIQTQYTEKILSSPDIPDTYIGHQVRMAFVMEGNNGDRWLIDNVMVVEKCNAPTGLSADDFGLTSATFSWTASANAANYEIEVVEAAALPSGIADYTSTTTSYTATDLTAGTDYVFYVRAECSVSGANSWSEWAGPFEFSTIPYGDTCDAPIEINTVSYFETSHTDNFDDDYSGAPGTGCNASGSYLNGNDVVYAYSASFTGSININLSNTGPNAGIFVYDSCDAIGTNCIAGGSGNATTPVNIATLAVTAGETYYIVISTSGTTQSTPYTLTIQRVNCEPPVGQPTTAITETSAQLSWTNPSGATSWEVVLQTPGTGLPSGSGETVTDNPYIPTTLTAATPYEYYVRADCGDGTFSAWAGPYLFNTELCNPANQCTYTFVMTDSAFGWDGNTMTISQNGIEVATIGEDFTSGTGPVEVEVSLCNGLPFQLFWNAGGSYANEVAVAIKNPFGQTIFTKPQGAGAPNSIVYSGMANCLEAECMAPEDLTAINIGDTEAGLQWGGPATGEWEYVVVPTGDPAPADTDSGTSTTTNPVTAGGLTANTTYDYYVRIICSDTETSPWSDPYTFTTASCPFADQCVYRFIMTDVFFGWDGNTMDIRQNGVTVATIGETFTTGSGPIVVEVPLCGNQPFELFWNAGGSYANEVGVAIQNSFYQTIYTKPIGTGSPNTVLYTGNVDCGNAECIAPTGLDSDNITAFAADLSWDGQDTGNWEVYVVPAGDPAPTAGTAGEAATVNPYNYDGLDPETAYDFYVRIQCNGGADWSPWGGPHTFTTIATCLEPTDLNAINITEAAAELEWTESGTADEWDVYVVPAGDPAPTNATEGTDALTNPFPISSLTAGTSYEFYVRAVCSGTDVSEWSGPYEFNTSVCSPSLQCVYNFIMTDDFFGWDGNTMDIRQNGVTVATIGETFTSGTGPIVVEVPLCNGIPFELFWNAGGSYAYEVGVAIENPFGQIIYTKPIGEGSPDTSLFTGMANCDTPACLAPEGLYVTSIGDTTVELGWEGEATGSWEYFVVPAGGPAPADGTPGTPATTNPVEAGGLTAGTEYDFYVRQICSGTETSPWSEAFDFTTALCPLADQCVYTFVMTDEAFGWDGNTMTIRQGGVELATIGEDFTSGTGPVTIEIPMCHDIPFEVFWNPGGFYTSEVGLTIIDPFDDELFTKAPGTPGSPNAVLYSGTANCTPPPCDKPINLYADTDLTSASISWTSPDDAEEWEVVVVPQGDPNPETGTATTSMPYLVEDLEELTCYDFYVRSVCLNGLGYSNWTGPFTFCTAVENDDCDEATVVNVNPAGECVEFATGTVVGATPSSQVNGCFGSADDDVWFEFVAESDTHIITLRNITGSTTDLYHVVYEGDQCGSLNQLYCSDDNLSEATGLTPGNTYKIRVYTYSSTPFQTSEFEVCVRTPVPPIYVSTTDYTVEELVTDIFYEDSECALISNITSSTGSDFGLVNGIGYFTQNGSDFPMESGLLLVTGNANDAPGPNNSLIFNEFDAGWDGDTDLEEMLDIETGETYDASYIQFDFVPLIPVVSFDFLFASEEYNGGSFECDYSDSFAFILTDNDTGESVNLAVIPGTDIPIQVTNIHPDNGYCDAINEDRFGKYNLGDDSDFAAINFNGQTKPMTAISPVTPGHNYTIKLVIANEGDNSYASAIFLLAGSFNSGRINIGDDLLVDTGTAICDQSEFLLESGLDADDYDIKWFFYDDEIEGETGADLLVTVPGEYSVEAVYNGTDCTSTGTIVIEFYPPVEEITGEPVDLVRCDADGTATFNLEDNTPVVLNGLDPADFTISYHLTEDFAENGGPALGLSYENEVPFQQTVYVRMVYNLSGCVGVKSFDLLVDDLTPEFEINDDFSICEGSSAEITVVPGNFAEDDSNVTISWTHDTNPLPDDSVSITITEPGVYEVTVDNAGCPVTKSVTVTEVVIPVPDQLTDVTECDAYTLQPLTVGNYYTQPEGNGTMLNAGEIVTESQTLYVYAETGTTPNCWAETSFEVTIINSPDPVTPGDQTVCDSYILPALAEGNYYTLPNAGGTMLNENDVITTTQEIWVYVATTGGPTTCPAQDSFTVTVLTTPVADDIADVTNCDSYILPALSPGNNYYTGTGGTGTMLSANDVITQSQTVYVYAENGICTDETSFDITIVTSPVVDVISNQTVCGSYTLPALGVGSYYTGPGGTGTMMNAGEAITGEGIHTIYIYAETGTTPNCSDESVFTVDIQPTPVVTVPASEVVCDIYTLPTLSVGNYYTAPGGTGNMLSAGNVIIDSQTLYVYADNGVCSDEGEFTVTVIPTPTLSAISEGCEEGGYTLGVVFDADDETDQGNAAYAWSRTEGGAVISTDPTLTV
uniref:fibronectin type III domain-containing protein n=1 Tax=Flavobacterium sp. MK4S-17 TaxID=2543737 RepID=UPI001358EF33